jgi:hypothetical protein
MQAAERVLILGVAGLPRRLDRHVQIFSQLQQFRLAASPLLARGTSM